MRSKIKEKLNPDGVIMSKRDYFHQKKN